MICENCNCLHDGEYGSGRFCSSRCARGFSTKLKRQEINDKVSIALTNRTLTVETKKKISNALTGRKITWENGAKTAGAKISAGLQKHYQDNPMSLERRKRLSDVAKKRGLGGHTSKQRILFEKLDGSVIYLQSSFEIAYATLLESHSIKWTRPDPLLWFDANGEEHRYYADFYLVDHDIYIDTKNDYLIKKDADKIKRVVEQNSVKLKVLSSRELDWLPMPG